MVKEYVFDGPNGKTVVRIINADEKFVTDVSKEVQKMKNAVVAGESLKTVISKKEPRLRDVAGEDLETEFSEEMPKPRDLMQHLTNKQKEKEQALHLEFFEVLKSKDVAKICAYWKKNRLLASDEYQMLVFLATELDDDDEAENIICNYVHRYGLNSLKSRQLLRDLRFDKALKALPKDEEWSLIDEVSVSARINDGFRMLQSGLQDD